jgi:hypothetical protein
VRRIHGNLKRKGGMKKKAKKIGPGKLTRKPKFPIKGGMIRGHVLDQMQRLEWNAYRLGKALEGKVKRQSVYDDVAGRSDMTGANLWHVLWVLGLRIRPKE